jgi:UDP-N-acetylglucosamine 2-epimerase (hydrolysing)
VIGSPELDVHKRPSGVTLDQVRQRYNIPLSSFASFGIVVFHPVTSETETIGAQARALFDVLESSGKSYVVIAPNNDPGTEAIFAVLDTLPKDRFRLIPSMRFAYFSELMRHAHAVIGNSSAGVREAPFLGVPSLDIGTRQHQRAQAASLLNSSAFDSDTIELFLEQYWGKRFDSDAGFGSGHAAQSFVKVLLDDNYWSKGLQKMFENEGASNG